MQKWEYITVGTDKAQKVDTINGEHQHEKDRIFFTIVRGIEDLYAGLTRLGDEGWEVAGTASMEHSVLIILKRPKPENPAPG